jgi:hypothetical protein
MGHIALVCIFLHHISEIRLIITIQIPPIQRAHCFRVWLFAVCVAILVPQRWIAFRSNIRNKAWDIPLTPDAVKRMIKTDDLNAAGE